MRWIRPKYHPNDTRIHTFFAWFPVVVKTYDTVETRWLTTVTVKQCLYYGLRCDHWVNIEFI